MRTKYSIRNSITMFISNIITFLLLFIGQSVFIKILGIEYNGLNGLFNNVLTILNLFELGIGSSITYNLYKYLKNNDKETIKSIMYFYKKSYNLIALIIFIVGIVITPFLKFIIKETTLDINIYIVYILYLISTVSTYLISYKRNLLFADQKSYVINIINIMSVVVLNVFQILVIYITKNYYLYLIIKIICSVLENIVINMYVNKSYPYILDKQIRPLDNDIKDSIISRVKALIIHKISGAVTNGTDNIIISTFLGIATVGLYTNYFYIITSVKKLFSNIINSTGASVGNLLVDNNKENNYKVFKNIRFLNLWISIFTSCCLLILIKPFIILWIGKKYLLNDLVLIVLIINYFQTMMRSTYSVFKDSAGIWIEDKYVPIIQLSINLISSIILLKIFGLAGVFMGTIISSLVLWLYSYPKFVYKKLFDKDYVKYYKEFFTNIFLFVFILTIVYLISNIFVIKSIFIKLFVNLIISILVPNLILYLLFRNKDEFKYYINLLRKIKIASIKKIK